MMGAIRLGNVEHRQNVTLNAVIDPVAHQRSRFAVGLCGAWATPTRSDYPPMQGASGQVARFAPRNAARSHRQCRTRAARLGDAPTARPHATPPATGWVDGAVEARLPQADLWDYDAGQLLYRVAMALKRIRSEADHRSLGHVRLWTEDLAAIVSLIEQATQDDVEIKKIDDELSAASVADLADYSRARMISFVVTAPGISLTLGTNVASLDLNEPNLTVLGMAHEIERIARMRKKSRRRLAGGIAKDHFTHPAFAIS